MKIAEETSVHFRTGRRDEKDVKIQLKIENRGEGVGVAKNGNQQNVSLEI